MAWGARFLIGSLRLCACGGRFCFGFGRRFRIFGSRFDFRWRWFIAWRRSFWLIDCWLLTWLRRRIAGRLARLRRAGWLRCICRCWCMSWLRRVGWRWGTGGCFWLRDVCWRGRTGWYGRGSLGWGRRARWLRGAGWRRLWAWLWLFGQAGRMGAGWTVRAGWAMCAGAAWFWRVGSADKRATWLLDSCCCFMAWGGRLVSNARLGLAGLNQRWASNTDGRVCLASSDCWLAGGARADSAWANTWAWLCARLVSGRFARRCAGCARAVCACRAGGCLGWRNASIRAGS